MRYYYKIFILGCLLATVTIETKAQWMSAITVYSPSTSSLIGNASRIGYDDSNCSMYYMRYNDSSYFCSSYYFTNMAFKVTMQQDFVITDFKQYFLEDPGFIGSYQGKGMYGYSFANYYNGLSGNTYFRVAKLDVVDQLNRVAVSYPTGQNAVIGMKSYTIGEKAYSGKAIPQNYILEYYMVGPVLYRYAPLAYSPSLNEQEIADDVITIDNYVIFATRDTRPNHAPINLRISDTNNVLSSNTDIDVQWQFLLPSYEDLYGKLRLLPLDEGMFVLAYTVFNTNDGEYYLCVHLIKLPSLLAGINGITSHEIQLNSDCYDLTDLIFKPDADVMVALLNGNGKSSFYHLNPYSTTTDITSKLNHSTGNFYSIDTIENYSSNEIMYMAMGDSTIFLQNIFNGPSIDMSCLEIKKIKSLLKEPPEIKKNDDPLHRYSADREYIELTPSASVFWGTRPCSKPTLKEPLNK